MKAAEWCFKAKKARLPWQWNSLDRRTSGLAPGQLEWE